MTFPLACPHCERLHMELQRDALAEGYQRFNAECSWCLRDQRAMAPVSFANTLGMFDVASADWCVRTFARLISIGLWPSSEALYIVVTREPTPFRFEYMAVPQHRESDADLVEYFGVLPPETLAVPRGALGAIRAP